MNKNVKLFVIAPLIGGILLLGYNATFIFVYQWWLYISSFVMGVLLVMIANFFALLVTTKEKKVIKKD